MEELNKKEYDELVNSILDQLIELSKKINDDMEYSEVISQLTKVAYFEREFTTGKDYLFNTLCQMLVRSNYDK